MKAVIVILLMNFFLRSEELINYIGPVNNNPQIAYVKTKIKIINGTDTLRTKYGSYACFDTTIVKYRDSSYMIQYLQKSRKHYSEEYDSSGVLTEGNIWNIFGKLKRVTFFRHDGSVSNKSRYLFGQLYNIRYYNTEGDFTSFGPEWSKMEYYPRKNFSLICEYPLVVSTTPYTFSWEGALPIFASEKNDKTTFNIIPEIGIAGGRLAVGLGFFENVFQLRGHVTGTWMNPQKANFQPLARGAHAGVDFELSPLFVTLRTGFLYSLAQAQHHDRWRFTWAMGIPIGGWLEMLNAH